MVVPEEINPEAPIELVRQMRASIVVLGPLLARAGEARVALPGGDDLGARPIDMHLHGLEAMGAEFELVHGELVGRVDGRLKGTEVELPFPSVGATENLLFAGATAEGETVIVNAAREPEIQDLIDQLVSMGAEIEGGGTSLVTVVGVESLSPVEHRVIPDRLEAGTLRGRRGDHRGRRDGYRLLHRRSQHGAEEARGGRVRGGARRRLASSQGPGST